MFEVTSSEVLEYPNATGGTCFLWSVEVESIDAKRAARNGELYYLSLDGIQPTEVGARLAIAGAIRRIARDLEACGWKLLGTQVSAG